MAKAKLIFEYSAMNGGKSTKLLQTNYYYESNEVKVLLLKSSLDDRTKNTIYSRIGLEKECFLIDPQESFLEKFSQYIKENNIEIVLVDEAQFLSKEQVIELREATILMSLVIICYGLRTTFEGKTFEGSAALLGLSDKIVENITLCKVCSKKASMNLKLDINGNVVKYDTKIIDTGMESKYKSVCYEHWYKAMKE